MKMGIERKFDIEITLSQQIEFLIDIIVIVIFESAICNALLRQSFEKRLN